ncbi:hypothetical protein ABIE64_003641 [Thalassospira sp. MBR-102]|uniref:Wadjet anti-phage system protein JetA family protein n=1 Tax=Thalassospira sp. MBR-102 TaxID=3156466 RepID=UPI0033972467
MALFGSLHDDFFGVFSGPNRFVFEAVIRDIYLINFANLSQFPTRNDLRNQIIETLRRNPEIWSDEESYLSFDDIITGKRRMRRRQGNQVSDKKDATSQLLLRANHVYARLVNCGWLNETAFGIRIVAEMPYGAILLAERLIEIEQRNTVRIGGLIVEIRNALLACRENQSENAPGLEKAAQNCRTFARGLRAILATLTELERSILSESSRNGRIRALMEQFVRGLLLGDFRQLMSARSHPYRHRREILDHISALKRDEQSLRRLGQAYEEHEIALDLDAALYRVHDDLNQISETFNDIDTALHEISKSRRRLERKLNNLVSYAATSHSSFARQALDLICRLDQSDGPDILPGLVLPRIQMASPELLRAPSSHRNKIKNVSVKVSEPEPLLRLKMVLENQYDRQINIPPSAVLRYLQRHVPPFGSTEACYLPITSIDDYFAFTAMQAAWVVKADEVLLSRLNKSFQYSKEQLTRDEVDNAWLKCGNFRIHRLDDAIEDYARPSLTIERTAG